MKKSELRQIIKEEIMKIKEMSLQSSDVNNLINFVKTNEKEILNYLDFNSINDLTKYINNSDEKEFQELEQEIEEYKKQNS